MHRRMLALALASLLATAGLPAARTAQAAPAARATAITVAGPPTEGTKVTLGDTSIDGPALWTIPGAGPSGISRSVLAWTGTDPAHHLNYMTSEDGVAYHDKHILNETSFARPSVTEQVDFEGGPQFIVLAWTGTDPQHTLNVLFIDAHTGQPTTKLTLWGETSFTAPAVAEHCCAAASELKLAWAGTDPAHTLNVISISADRKVTGKTTLWGHSSQAAPYLNDASPLVDTWLLSWADVSSRITFARLPVQGGTGIWEVQPPLAEWSYGGPSMVDVDSGEPRYWLAWSGTFGDTAHHLNIQFTTTFPAWPTTNTKTTMAETCLGGPEVGILRFGGLGPGVSSHPVVAWTGTDASHHLNIATISV